MKVTSESHHMMISAEHQKLCT